MGFNICQWTAERIAMLRRLWTTGMPASKIAKEMGDVTRNGVIGKAHRLGIAADHHADAPIPAKRKHRRKHKPAAPPVALFVVPVITELPPDPPSTSECTIMELTERSCRWPIGEPCDLDTFRYCGAPKWSGSYCRRHAKVAWKSGGQI